MASLTNHRPLNECIFVSFLPAIMQVLPSVLAEQCTAAAVPVSPPMRRPCATAEDVRDMLWFKRLGRRLRVWHRAITQAAEEGGADLLAAALAAEEQQHGWLAHCPDLRREELRHPCSVEEQPSACGLPVALAVPRSPFPADSEFGILPYSAWHGHLEVVRAFVEAGAPLEATALVRGCSIY